MTKLKSLALLGAAALAAFPSLALAQVTDVADMSDQIGSQAAAIANLLGVVSFVAGLGLAIAGLLKFRAHSQNPNDPSNKLSTAFMLIFVGAGMVMVPTILGIGVGTLFGGGTAATSSATGTSQWQEVQ